MFPWESSCPCRSCSTWNLTLHILLERCHVIRHRLRSATTSPLWLDFMQDCRSLQILFRPSLRKVRGPRLYLIKSGESMYARDFYARNTDKSRLKWCDTASHCISALFFRFFKSIYLPTYFYFHIAFLWRNYSKKKCWSIKCSKCSLPRIDSIN